MAFEGNNCCFYMYGYSNEINSCNWVFILNVCAVIWGLHVSCIRSCDQKSHLAPDFKHLDPRNAIVLLMMLLLPCNANASTNGVT